MLPRWARCHTQPLCLLNTPGGRVRQGEEGGTQLWTRQKAGQEAKIRPSKSGGGAAQPGVGAGTMVSTAPEGRAKTKRGLITVIRAAID